MTPFFGLSGLSGKRQSPALQYPPIILVDPEEETDPEMTVVRVVEPLPVSGIVQGGEMGEEQEPRVLGFEGEVTTYMVAPEE